MLHFKLKGLFIIATCPEYDIDYYGHHVGLAYNIESWEACGILCKERANCYAWTWLRSWRKCHFKTSVWSQGRKALRGAISGQKLCVGRLEEANLNLYSLYIRANFIPNSASSLLFEEGY